MMERISFPRTFRSWIPVLVAVLLSAGPFAGAASA